MAPEERARWFAFAREFVSDAFLLAGCASAVYGVSAEFGAGFGWIVGGCVTVGLGVLLGARE